MGRFRASQLLGHLGQKVNKRRKCTKDRDQDVSIKEVFCKLLISFISDQQLHKDK